MKKTLGLMLILALAFALVGCSGVGVSDDYDTGIGEVLVSTPVDVDTEADLEDAIIKLDGEEQDKNEENGFQDNLLAGDYNLVVENYGYENYETKFTIERTKTTTVNPKLKELERGEVILTLKGLLDEGAEEVEALPSSIEVNVTIDGVETVEAVTDNQGEIELKPYVGERSIAVATEDYGSGSITIDVEENVVKEGEVVLSAGLDNAIRLHYKAAEDQEVPTIWAWNDDGSVYEDMGYSWPGAEMKSVGGNWYSVTIPAEELEFIIAGDTDEQFQDEISGAGEYFYDSEAEEWLDSDEFIRLHYKAAEDQEVPTIWAWNDDGSVYEDMGYSWPGAEMKSVGGNWYSVTIPAEELEFIIAGDTDEQFQDEISGAGEYFYDSEAEEWLDSDEFIRLHYKAAEDQEVPTIWAWNDDGSVYEDMGYSWPGAEMQSVGGNWYSVTIPAEELEFIIAGDTDEQFQDEISGAGEYFYDSEAEEWLD
ncbi:starch-binding protein [Halonatronum saccharophilum]|uniref:starch-binding protein n=1 Tax=Halonatronum saccharophilum TaxID=150060 RepID=UPI0004858A23|nr:starch-binding protein [Halonatronum saccharophilum]